MYGVTRKGTVDNMSVASAVDILDSYLAAHAESSVDEIGSDKVCPIADVRERLEQRYSGSCLMSPTYVNTKDDPENRAAYRYVFPGEVLSCGSWSLFKDEETDRYYFYDARTGQSQWNCPEGGDVSGLSISQAKALSAAATV